MPETMVLLPRTASDDEQHEAILDLLEHRAGQARYYAQELRVAPGVPRLEGPRVARALRKLVRAIDEFVDEPELTNEQALELLGLIQPAVDEAERMLAAADVCLAVDEATFIGIGDSVTAIANLAMVAFSEFLADERVDIAELMPVEREAPVPLMHALQRVTSEGFVAARAGAPCPAWLAPRLEQTVAELLEARVVEEGPLSLVSPFVRVGSIACHRIGELWRAEQPTRQLERYAGARTATVDASLETLALQREQLPLLPDLAHWYDAGHAYGVIEQLLEQLAERQDLITPRNLHAALWFDLLMGSADEEPA